MSGWTIVAASVMIAPLAVHWLSRPDRPGPGEGEYRVVEYGPGYRVAMLVCFAFFAALAALAYHFPGKTDPASLRWAIGMFVFFSGWGLGVFGLMNRASLYWNSQQVLGPNAWGKRTCMSWSEIAVVEYVAWAQGFRLQNAEGAVIWFSPMMVGFRDFFQELVRECKPRGLMEFLEDSPDDESE